MNYDFDKVQLQRDCYRPIAHGDLETTQANILKGLEDILKGKTSLPMTITNIPFNDTSATTEQMQQDSYDLNTGNM